MSLCASPRDNHFHHILSRLFSLFHTIIDWKEGRCASRIGVDCEATIDEKAGGIGDVGGWEEGDQGVKNGHLGLGGRFKEDSSYRLVEGGEKDLVMRDKVGIETF